MQKTGGYSCKSAPINPKGKPARGEQIGERREATDPKKKKLPPKKSLNPGRLSEE